MARYSLFVLKVPSNPKQTNKQTFNFMHSLVAEARMWSNVKWDFSGEREQFLPGAVPDATNDPYVREDVSPILLGGSPAH